MKVSYSRVSTYMDCPRKHYFRYIQGVRPKTKSRPLVFGSDFHKLLEHRHDPKQLKTIKQTIRDNAEDSDYLDDLMTIFEDYQEVWANEEKPMNNELEIMVPMGKYKGEIVYFHGILDEIYNGDILGEHKTYSSAPDISTLVMNLQVLLYSKAWEKLTGKGFKRIRWDYTKSKPASYPVWLEKSHRFSDAKSTTITPMSYKRACKEKGVDSSKAYLYEPNISNFFWRYEVDVLPSMRDKIWNSFVELTKQVISKGDTNETQHISRDCSWCDFRPLCFAEFTGADVQYILNTDYDIVERR